MVSDLTSRFSNHQNKDRALDMSNYMKGHFPFYGIPSPLRKVIQKEWLNAHPESLSMEKKWKIVFELWSQERREYHYVACDWTAQWKPKELQIDDIELIKKLIVTNSWWDSVDALAPNLLNTYFLQFPEMEEKIITEWVHSDNLWLKRSCLIYQLKRKHKTNIQQLISCIEVLKHEKEFFIQKAIGWSLRQLARIHPDEVRKITIEQQLNGLALREATKYLS
jgi:3-methyladenine DNA glycosylase AlkD